jgi:hypothetical protein
MCWTGQFANSSNDVSSSSTFGVISGLTVSPRTMQFALKPELQFAVCNFPGRQPWRLAVAEQFAAESRAVATRMSSHDNAF